jgi:hypothetical protein
MHVMMMFLVAAGPPDTVDSGYRKPDDMGIFLLCVAAAVVFVALVLVAASIANRREMRRGERNADDGRKAAAVKPGKAG